MAVGKRPKKTLSPLAFALGKDWLEEIDQEMTLEKVLAELKPIHDEILKGEANYSQKSDEPAVDTTLLNSEPPTPILLSKNDT